MLKLNQTYTHYKNKQNYLTIDFCKIQENDIWVKAVIYKPENEEGLFVREDNEFKEKFIETTTR
jgi:hypothetical protein